MNRTPITSRDNQHLKQARKIRDGDRSGLIFVEGLRLVKEALLSDIDIVEVFITESALTGPHGDDVIKILEETRFSTFELSENLFASISDTKGPQGIALLCRRPETTFQKFAAKRESVGNMPIYIYLSEINNPSNLGAIARTAEAAGAGGVIVSNRSSDIFSAKALRAAMGSTFRMTIWESATFDEAAAWARTQGLVLTAADSRAASAYTEVDWTKPRLLVLGSEGHGLGSDVLASVDEAVRIPMKSGVESLNLAVSSGILLFEAVRQNAG